jgi:ABC-type dipeptide/oligopeptide/nickel transport system permease subunit
MLKVGAAIVLVMALAAILVPSVTPFDPAQQELPLRLAGPTWSHPLGLDELGRDILARVLAGARISFFVALVVVTVSAGIGTTLGAVAGYFGGALLRIGLGRGFASRPVRPCRRSHREYEWLQPLIPDAHRKGLCPGI